MLQIGDIVRVESALKYVAVDFLGGPSDDRLVRLIRKASNGVQHSFVRSEADLTILEQPHFEIGQAVTVNGQAGTVVGGETQNGPVLVQLPATTKPLTNAPDIKIAIDSGVAAVPIWLLVLENKM